MNNFDKLQVQKPKQGEIDRRTARQRPWTMTDYAVHKAKSGSPKKSKKKSPRPEIKVQTPEPKRMPVKTSPKMGITTYFTKQDNDFYDLAASELTPSEERLYQRLFRMSWGYQKNTCRISILDLAQMVKSDPRQIRRLREGLVKKGWIEILSTRLEAITSKKPLEYRIYAAREIIAARNQQDSAPEENHPSMTDHQGQDVPSQFDPGQGTRGKIAADMSPESPQTPEKNGGKYSIDNMISEQPIALKKQKENKEIINPLNPPKKNGGANFSIPPEMLIRAEQLTETFYDSMNWSQQTDRIRQSDIASIVNWHYYEGFEFDVIERAITEIAKKSDTRSIKRAEFYLAPMSKNTPEAADEDQQKQEYDEEIRQKEERIAKLERIKQKVNEEDFNELFQTQFDELQAENPSIPVFILETLARQKANQELLNKYADG